MAKLFSWIVLAPLGLIIIIFSASNRALVTLELWPLPFAVTAPAFAVALGCAVGGFLFGACAAFVSGAAKRLQARNLERELTQRAEAAEREAAQLKDKLAQLKNQPDILQASGAGQLAPSGAGQLSLSQAGPAHDAGHYQ